MMERSGVTETVSAEAEKIAELSAIIQAVRDRVRARYPQGPSTSTAPEGQASTIHVAPADLLPIVHARDAAQAKIAAIGSVNPRPGGVVNSVIQTVKRTISRALQWFVRDQVTFNRETVAAIEAILEALNDHNRAFVSLANQVNQQLGPFALENEKNFNRHWNDWRDEWERKLLRTEVQILRNVAELQGAFQHRVTQIETNFRDIVKSQHADYLAALDRSTLDVQKRLWADMERIRAEYERLIHTELRLIRQRAPGAVPHMAIPVPQMTGAGIVAASSTPAGPAGLDYSRFAERFRGSQDYVRRNQEFYRPFFEKCEDVLDIGCGRGEFLDVMRAAGVRARGIDLDEESIGVCRQKGLDAEAADLFAYLPAQPDGEFDGIFSAQVVEHIPPDRLPVMIQLCGAKVRRGGVVAFETPNPECLAIFATHFYLDPTHTRPVPHGLLSFYLAEAGFGSIEVHKLAPAIESMPEIGELPEHFRDRFFGGLDYAIIARKL
jgi:2-polyprenyl-3-methyl-5-hydroxy-6-metoxy-1,4-benzoquinol methylase